MNTNNWNQYMKKMYRMLINKRINGKINVSLGVLISKRLLICSKKLTLWGKKLMIQENKFLKRKVIIVIYSKDFRNSKLKILNFNLKSIDCKYKMRG